MQHNRRPDCDGSAKRSLAPATEIRARLLPQGGGQHVSPQYGQNEKAASKRKIAVSPYNGSGLPDDLQAAPPIRLSGRNLTEIRRQRLRYISS
ncbi:hypothetical protein A5CBH24_23170 [Alistipes communis]|uniref:Uncharacterized protein n=1 Tax=Alistipes communis TaxID=2585118 RepID=A0A4Y1WX11_9BACT|nr:hypothetical protein A5CBH24_23170 [Alistipes communis]